LGVFISGCSAAWLAATLFLLTTFFLFPRAKEMANKIIGYTFMLLLKPWVENGGLLARSQAQGEGCLENQTYNMLGKPVDSV
jgi:hypothetical protein